MNLENKSDQYHMAVTVIARLQEIAAQPEHWSAAKADPRSFLQNQYDIELPADTLIELYDIARDTGKTMLYAAELEVQIGAQNSSTLTYQPVVHGADTLIRYLTERNMGCPLGTMPYKTLRRVEKCIKYALIKGGIQWVPVEEGSPLGHFEYTDIQKVCLQSVTMNEEVIECLSFIQPR